MRNMTISGNRLEGAIPEEIGKLTSLVTLKISNEKLTGSLPASLGSLSNLTYLVISQTSISGNIPDGLRSLTQLETLNLSDNKLGGEIPDAFAAMSALRYVNLNGNALTGGIPASMGGSSSLLNLLVADNKLSVALADGIFTPGSGQSSLLNINLRGNQFSGQFPSSAFGPTVRSVDASNNKFLGDLKFPEAEAAQLVNVNLSGNSLSGGIPDAIFTSPKIGDVNLANNGLTGELPASLGQATNLRQLNVSNNALTGAIPDISSLQRLTTLQIDGNQMSGEIPANFPAVSTLRLLPNACFTTDDSAVQTYLARKGYTEPYGPCPVGAETWGVSDQSCRYTYDKYGTVTFRAANPSDKEITTTVTLIAQNLAQRTELLRVPPGATNKIEFTDIPNGGFKVSAKIGSNLIYTGNSVLDCTKDGGEGKGDTDRPTVTATVMCLAGNSKLDIKLDNPTEGPVDFTVKVGTFATREANLGPKSQQTVSVFGLPDGPIIITPTATGYTLDQIPVAVNCTSSLSKPVEATASCMVGPAGISRGRFDVAIRNTSSVRSVFTLLIDQQLSNGTRSSTRSRTLSSNQLWKFVVPNLADGSYKLSVQQGSDTPTEIGTFDVACAGSTPVPDGGIRVITTCLAGTGRADVFIQNTGADAATYTATYGTGSVAKSTELSPNGRGRLVLFNGSDGLGPVTVKRGGVEALSQPVTTSPCS